MSSGIHFRRLNGNWWVRLAGVAGRWGIPLFAPGPSAASGVTTVVPLKWTILFTSGAGFFTHGGQVRIFSA